MFRVSLVLDFPYVKVPIAIRSSTTGDAIGTGFWANDLAKFFDAERYAQFCDLAI